MRNVNLFSEMEKLGKEIESVLDDNWEYPDPTMDPRLITLLERGVAINKELDLLMRQTFPDRPEELAKWQKKMDICREADPEAFIEALREQAADLEDD
jgi:hypothetical protein